MSHTHGSSPYNSLCNNKWDQLVKNSHLHKNHKNRKLSNAANKMFTKPGKTIVFLNFITSDLYLQEDTAWFIIIAESALLVATTLLLLLLAKGKVNCALSFSIDSKSAFSHVILLLIILI